MTEKPLPRARMLGLTLAIAAGPLAAGHAWAAETALVQPGDRDLSCDALAGQINALAQSDAEPVRKKKKKGGFGFLTKALSAASPMLGNLGQGTGALVAGQAAAAVQSAQMEAQMDDQMALAMAATNPRESVEQQRRARLMAIFEDKNC